MLDRGNLYLIDYALSRLPSNASLVEIGSFCGLSTNLITYYKSKHRVTNKLFTCDKWEFEGSESEYVGDSSVLFSNYKGLVRDSFLRNTHTSSGADLLFSIEAFSNEFFSLWKEGRVVQDIFKRSIALGGPISFCYVDGNHSYDGAKADFLNCDAFLEVGSFLLFDDSIWQGFGVHRLMPEVLATNRYQLEATKRNHLFRKTRS